MREREKENREREMCVYLSFFSVAAKVPIGQMAREGKERHRNEAH